MYASARRLGNPEDILCPCIDCRNVCHQPLGTVIDHLVIRGMDQKYKMNTCWSKHGDIRETADVQISELSIAGLEFS